MAGRYAVVYADPPWRYETWSDKGRDRCPDARHYPVASLDELKVLPVADLAARDSVLFMWVPGSHLPQALELGAAWGFTYRTNAFVWVKRTKRDREHFGGGHWTRRNPEQCLLFTRGSPRRLARDVRELIVSPVREHSRKPDEVWERIERLVAGPYLELFARTRRPGWDTAFSPEADRFPPVGDRPHGGPS